MSLRQEYPHLTDAQLATLEKMASLLGEKAIDEFPSLTADQQRGRLERFGRYESSLIAHGSAAAREAARNAARMEAQSAAQSSVPYMQRHDLSKPIKVHVSTFDGKEADSLVFWIREIEIAVSAGQIRDARTQVAFAISNLGGRARSWAMAKETATPGYFTSWVFMAQEIRQMFLILLSSVLVFTEQTREAVFAGLRHGAAELGGCHGGGTPVGRSEGHCFH